MSKKHSERSADVAFKSEMLKSAFVSAIFAAFQSKQERSGYRLQDLANALGKDRAIISRWFSGSRPANWQVGTMAEIADAMNLSFDIKVKDEETGRVFAPSGEVATSRVQDSVAPSSSQNQVEYMRHVLLTASALDPERPNVYIIDDTQPYIVTSNSNRAQMETA